MQAIAKGPKACTTCAKAKARCIPGETGDKCERCQRLGKECFSRPPAPPRIKKRPKRSRVAELEKRLNELSSQVGNSHPRLPTPETVANGASAEQQATKGNDIVSFGHLFPPETGTSPLDDATSASSPEQAIKHPHQPWDNEAFKHMDSLWPQPDEASALLDDFRDSWEAVFPFIILRRGISSEEVRDRRPFLWKAIMMVTCFFDGARQVKLGEQLLADIARASMVEGVKTLDLLQGLQLLIGWFHYAVKGTQLTNLLFLARSMCVNLNSMGCEPLPSGALYSNLDPLRSYAATYYLNTLVFTTNKKIDIFMNTSHLELCCRALENACEYPSDVYLVKLVKIQQLAQSISITMAFDPTQPAMQLPLTMVVQSFQEQIGAYRESLPPHLQDNGPLNAHIAIAEVLLMDISISEQHCGAHAMPLTERLELLWSCVRALHSFFDVRAKHRSIESPRFLFLTASDIAYTIITSIKLLMLRLPGWNVKQIGGHMGLNNMLEWQIDDLSQVVAKRKDGRMTTEKAVGIAEDPFERLLRLLKNAQELTSLQIQHGEMDSGTSQYLAGDLDESLWFDIVNETAWNMNDEIMSG